MNGWDGAGRMHAHLVPLRCRKHRVLHSFPHPATPRPLSFFPSPSSSFCHFSLFLFSLFSNLSSVLLYTAIQLPVLQVIGDIHPQAAEVAETAAAHQLACLCALCVSLCVCVVVVGCVTPLLFFYRFLVFVQPSSILASNYLFLFLASQPPIEHQHVTQLWIWDSSINRHFYQQLLHESVFSRLLAIAIAL